MLYGFTAVFRRMNDTIPNFTVRVLLSTQQFACTEVLKPKVLDDLVTLCAFPTSWSTCLHQAHDKSMRHKRLALRKF